MQLDSVASPLFPLGRIWIFNSAIQFIQGNSSGWYAPTPANFWSFPSGFSARDYSSDIDVIGRKLYVGSIFGKIAIVDLDNIANLASGPQSTTKFLTTTAGTVSTIKMVNLDSSVSRFTHAYIGSDASIISKWNIQTERIESLFVYSTPTGSSSNIYALDYDAPRKVIWAAAGKGDHDVRILRVQESAQDLLLVDQSIWDSGSDGRPIPTTLIVDSVFNQVTFGISNDLVPTFNISTCAGSCQSCLTTDDRYCGFCLVDAACSASRLCSSEWLQDSTQCPRTVGISPNAGARDGGTQVAIQGTRYVDSRPQDYLCQFNGSATFAPTSLNSTHIVCRSPASALARNAGLSVLYKGQVWNDAVTFRYYSCDRDCGSCFTESECGWCLRTSNCSSVRECAAADFDFAACPVVQSVTPSSAETVSSSSVTLSISRVISGSYSCKFGAAASVSASSVATGSPGSISCPSPTSEPAAFVNLTISLASSASPYAPSRSFELYSCSAGNPCFSCVASAHPNCVFCLASLNCQRSSNTTCPIAPPDRNCPLLTSLVPRSASVATLTGRNLTLVGNIAAVADMACDWGAGVRTSAASINATHITCPFPASPVAADIQVSLYSGATPYSNPLPFRFYDCAAISSCSACVNVLNAECRWCVSGSTLKCALESNTTTSCGASPLVLTNSSCPRILSVSADNGALDGGVLINITTSIAPTQVSTLECQFGGSLRTAATIVGSVVSCLTPSPFSSTGNVSVEVILNAKSFALPSLIRVYDCAVDDSAVTASRTISSCSQCLAPSRPYCTWCASASCTSLRACASGTITQCPTLIDVFPLSGSADGGETVTIRAGSLPTDTSSITLECQFGTTSVSAVIADGGASVLCTSPASLAVGPVSLRLLVNGVPFAPQTLSFRYFRASHAAVVFHC